MQPSSTPSPLQPRRLGQAGGRRAPGTVVAGCWEAARTRSCCCNGSPQLHPSLFADAWLVCTQGMMFQQEEATDTQGGSHASMTCPATPVPADPGLRSNGPQAQLAAKLGSLLLSAELKHTGCVKVYWGAVGACPIYRQRRQGTALPTRICVVSRCCQQWEAGEPPSEVPGRGRASFRHPVLL